jgi:hypothetical protein
MHRQRKDTMRRIFAPAAIAAVALPLALPTASFADSTFSNPGFDLGVNVTGIHTPAAAQNFLMSLSPTTQRAVMGGCRNYVANPANAMEASTLPFCEAALQSPVAAKIPTSQQPVGTAASPSARLFSGPAIDWNKYYGD